MIVALLAGVSYNIYIYIYSLLRYLVTFAITINGGGEQPNLNHYIKSTKFTHLGIDRHHASRWACMAWLASYSPSRENGRIIN